MFRFYTEKSLSTLVNFGRIIKFECDNIRSMNYAGLRDTTINRWLSRLRSVKRMIKIQKKSFWGPVIPWTLRNGYISVTIIHIYRIHPAQSRNWKVRSKSLHSAWLGTRETDNWKFNFQPQIYDIEPYKYMRKISPLWYD